MTRKRNPPTIEQIPIEEIRVINPRFRDKRKFERMVKNIDQLGLKKPITVSRRSTREGQAAGYDLVCGQGRMEAYQALGQTNIPAVVVDVPKEERLLMSLIENIARRHSSGVSHFRNVIQLKERGYTPAEIGTKIGLSETYVDNMFRLLAKGEERLLDAVLQDKVNLTTAMEISDLVGEGDQVALLEAYSKKEIDKGAFHTIRRLLEQRKLHGKTIRPTVDSKKRKDTSTASLLGDYQREAQKQKTFIRKSKSCEIRLHLIVGALQQLLRDENFRTLLQAEGLDDMPTQLAERVGLSTAAI